MDRPKKKEIPEDIGNPMLGWSNECGYNQACEDWEAYHEVFRKQTLRGLNNQLFVVKEGVIDKITKGTALEGLCPEISKDYKKGYCMGSDDWEKNLPGTGEIAEITWDIIQCHIQKHPEVVNEDKLEELLYGVDDAIALAIHKRIRGEK